jgi:hypothetical protein
MQREQLPRHRAATYVMPRWQSVYAWINKAACTSLKWLVADLQGESPERFHRALTREVSRTMTIHRRQLWQHTPTAASLSDEELAAISPEAGWFIFAVTRHPTARLFSAWQSKLLLREPAWEERFGGEPWFPRVPRSGDEIVEDFIAFTRAMGADPGHRIMRNRHFAPQPPMLALGRMPYTRVYRTSEIPQLLEDFEAHLRSRGYEGTRLSLRRANEAPLRPIPALFTEEVLETAAHLYADDFAALGYDDVLPGGLDPSNDYSEAAVAEVGRLVERSQRLNDLALRVREFKRQARRAAAPAPAPPATDDRSAVVRAGRRLAGTPARLRRRLTAG